ALCVAEEVGLPLYGVVIPNHFFIRYDDGTVRRNLELTRGGALLDDDAIRRALQLPKDSLYLRSLDHKGLHACLLHNRGYVAMLAGKKTRARRDLERAIAVAPGLGEAHRNLGVLLGEARQWRAAAARFTNAVRLYPADWDAWAGLAVCRERLDDVAAARGAWQSVLEGRPGDKRATAALARLAEPPAGHAPGLRARYYAGTRHETLVHERVDKTIDFDWKNAAPAPKVPRDGFSVRWDGWFFAPKAGLYTFFLVANDGFRLEVGGKMLLDDWRDRRYENAFESADVRLEAGLHKIRIEHADFAGGARLMLRVGREGEPEPIPHVRCLVHRIAKK
ncbi:MAG: PA14 domain-containing protein, partial [Planctomycetota bacterium]|nr:PA14 domain-containing protein [Planctomycetota bacterium]